MTGPAAAGDCAGCGHHRVWHTGAGPRRCTKTVYQWIGGNSGPGMEIPRPCPCTGYTPQEVTMMPEPGGPPAPAPPPATADEVLAILVQLRHAYVEVADQLAAAHQACAAAVGDARQAWHDKTTVLEAQLRDKLGAPPAGGAQ